ncbi:efflux transporter outer membrane subunit [Rhizobium binae]|uniref:efflux transporter outer membrane subunit n=1 Tax=Rhizobium binae TaxID=1138190 RepID=UPI001441C695|nr:efflux transporter outer membrane subunit [Rhizobium binae]NKL48595.1 efflux transporter outer membrane subunit [Rhizobium leguminosarum bv. viciae]MBX4927839.1 efflux transporter outer membrane subunit [Rhizobium binae]MBX4938501.1 efflux transporter outer membrane subunit [Rhizobium binae]MBX4945008.1 efflux transporter outer membrane subunit [Rhizobium binae]MBX4952216.1 efflux transporter outer membrane subunit [Rhizobium binae]
MVSLRFATPALLLLLSGCVVGPDHAPPEMPLPAKFGEGGTKSLGDVATAAWWTAFRDPKLNGYVQAGLDQNLTVQQAIERINAASANVTVAGAGGLPNLTVGGSQTVSGQRGELRTQFDTRNTSAGDVQLSWLLDLFGLYKRSTESAVASLDSAYASADVAKLTLVQDLVSSYIDVRYYQQRLALSKANLKSRQETYELTKFQLEAGAASRLDVVQAEGLVQSTLAEIPGLETNIRISAHHIATLLGLPASALVNELLRGGGQPVFRGGINSGIPADLIRNRPDIRVAERDLAAATANIGVAEAQLYPSISLSGSISPSYINQRGIHGGLTPWSFGPTLNLPIFDGGRLRANVKSAQSDAASAYLNWKSTVLTAVEQVENALAAVRRDAQTVAALQAQVKTTQETLELSTASYKDGASSLLDVLDAQRQVSLAQASLAQSVQQMAKDYVSLNIAVGGGYAPGGKTTAPVKPEPAKAKS